jgi:hypothetical protein
MKTPSAVSPVFSRLPTVENELAEFSANCRVLPLCATPMAIESFSAFIPMCDLVIATACENDKERNSKYETSKISNAFV